MAKHEMGNFSFFLKSLASMLEICVKPLYPCSLTIAIKAPYVFGLNKGQTGHNGQSKVENGDRVPHKRWIVKLAFDRSCDLSLFTRMNLDFCLKMLSVKSAPQGAR